MILKKNNVERVAGTESELQKLISAGFKPLETVMEMKAEAEEKPLDKMKADELKTWQTKKGLRVQLL